MMFAFFNLSDTNMRGGCKDRNSCIDAFSEYCMLLIQLTKMYVSCTINIVNRKVHQFENKKRTDNTIDVLVYCMIYDNLLSMVLYFQITSSLTPVTLLSHL